MLVSWKECSMNEIFSVGNKIVKSLKQPKSKANCRDPTKAEK